MLTHLSRQNGEAARAPSVSASQSKCSLRAASTGNNGGAMAPVQPYEVRPGLVIYLEPRLLVGQGCLTSARPGAEVSGGHFFLTVRMDPAHDRCLACPLYSRKEGIRDRILLDERFKTGKPEHWQGTESYFFKWQFCFLPLGIIPSASIHDTSSENDRRGYAIDHPAALLAVTRDLPRMTTPYRPWD